MVKQRLLKQFKKGNLGKKMINPIIRNTLPIKDAPKPSEDIKHTLYGKQKGHCNGCKVHFEFRMFQLDHIVPKAKGGQDTDKNLQLLCGPCNSLKGIGKYVRVKSKIKKERFYNYNYCLIFYCITLFKWYNKWYEDFNQFIIVLTNVGFCCELPKEC